MKKLFYLLAISGLACMFQSCGNNPQRTTGSSDSSMIAKDSTFSAVKDTVTPAQADTTFADKASLGGMAEVELGQLAVEKASTEAVRDFAAMMVKDHGIANAELKAIASSKNITLPAAIDAAEAKKKQELQFKSGADFDKAYVMTMVEGHEKTLALMEEGSRECKDADLKSFAVKTASLVKQHLDMIKKIQKNMK